MTKLISVIILAAVLSFGTGAHAQMSTPTEVIVLAGQSNMLGRGFPLNQGEASDPNLYVYRPQNNQGWTVAVDPLGDPSDPKNGVGPGMTFGKNLVEQAPTVASIGLIQCAVAGSSIQDWQPGGQIYTKCMKQVQQAGLSVVGVLWDQGEADATALDSADQWYNRFQTLYKSLRHDLNIPGSRIVIAQTGLLPSYQYPYQAKVRKQQSKAASSLGLQIVTTTDLAMQPGQPHFTVAAYKTLGSRFATAWRKVAP